jgi:hypothetical protein
MPPLPHEEDEERSEGPLTLRALPDPREVTGRASEAADLVECERLMSRQQPARPRHLRNKAGLLLARPPADPPPSTTAHWRVRAPRSAQGRSHFSAGLAGGARARGRVRRRAALARGRLLLVRRARRRAARSGRPGGEAAGRVGGVLRRAAAGTPPSRRRRSSTGSPTFPSNLPCHTCSRHLSPANGFPLQANLVEQLESFKTHNAAAAWTRASAYEAAFKEHAQVCAPRAPPSCPTHRRTAPRRAALPPRRRLRRAARPTGGRGAQALNQLQSQRTPT